MPAWFNLLISLWNRSAVSQGGVLVPSGQTIPFMGATIPQGWLAADGSSISQTTYPALFAALGTTWGSAGPGLFNLPDLRGKVLIGTSPSILFASSAPLGRGGSGAELPSYVAINYIVKT
jgi:Phage Tail Collar Domain